MLAALADVANWRFVFTGNSYADLFAEPSPVQHFWSLAIEEQFYATFPLLVAGVVAIRRRPRPALLVVLATMAAASITLMLVLSGAGHRRRARLLRHRHTRGSSFSPAHCLPRSPSATAPTAVRPHGSSRGRGSRR